MSFGQLTSTSCPNISWCVIILDLISDEVSFHRISPSHHITWHKLEFRLAWNFAFLEQTGKTFRCTGRCQILVAVCLHSLLKFARYVACLPSHRWVKRVLAWTPPGSRNAGRPANSWDYCRYKNFGNWVDAAEDQHWWECHLDDFINFCRLWV